MRARSLRLVAAILAGCATFAGNAADAGAQALVPEGRCRDGQPNGAYTLHSASGAIRVAGALAKGRLTGTFVFWTESGVRLAVIPYDDGLKSGTVATWYPQAGPRGQSRRKHEAPYVDNVLHGIARSWYADGRMRGEFRYERGELIEAEAWSETGGRLAEREARQLAAADRAAAENTYATLEREVTENAPLCP